MSYSRNTRVASAPTFPAKWNHLCTPSTEVLPSLRCEDATAFLTRAIDWFARLGVRVER